MKTISIFTSSRAEYHLLSPLIRKISSDVSLRLDLIVSGTHLSSKYGHTVDQIMADGFEIGEEIETIDEDAETDVNLVIAKTLTGCAGHFKRVRSDFLVVLGDRYEIMGAVLAAANALVPIAHIHGGETTEGAVDEAVRHSVTKFSYLHFPSCEPYRKRIIQLGESPERVFNSGSLGVENILSQKLMEKDELERNLGFVLKKFCLVTFHPVTLEADSPEVQVRELMAALKAFPEYSYIITKANADQGGETVNRTVREEAEGHTDRFLLVDSLGMVRYLSAMKHCEMVIGNSSSGLLEAPSFAVPTVNVGDRQKGRISAASVINCIPEREEIANAMKKAASREFRDSIRNMPQLYGDGSTSEIIINEIKKALAAGVDLKKRFYDICIPEV